MFIYRSATTSIFIYLFFAVVPSDWSAATQPYTSSCDALCVLSPVDHVQHFSHADPLSTIMLIVVNCFVTFSEKKIQNVVGLF